MQFIGARPRNQVHLGARLCAKGRSVIAGRRLKLLHGIDAGSKRVAAVLILLDGHAVEKKEVIVSALAVHVEALRRWIDLDRVKCIAVLRAGGPGRKKIQLQEISAVQRNFRQSFAFDHGSDFRGGLVQERSSGCNLDRLGDLADL